MKLQPMDQKTYDLIARLNKSPLSTKAAELMVSRPKKSMLNLSLLLLDLMNLQESENLDSELTPYYREKMVSILFPKTPKEAKRLYQTLIWEGPELMEAMQKAITMENKGMDRYENQDLQDKLMEILDMLSNPVVTEIVDQE